MTELKQIISKMKVLTTILLLAIALISCTGKDNTEVKNNNENHSVDRDNEKEDIKDKDQVDTNDKEDKNNNEKDNNEKDNNSINNEEDNEKQEHTTKENNNIDDKVEIDYQKIKPNELGHIMVIMYHGISDNPPYHVTEKQFLEDLEYMYENGYRPISMRDYIDNNINIEAGYTPILLTFDDGLSSTFSLVEQDGKLVPKTGTAIEILERFSKEHDGFDNKAALYINAYSIFDGAGTVEERISWLANNGYDVGNHTSSHAENQMLSRLSSRQIMEHIGIVDQIIKNAVPNYTVDSLAYTFGNRPVKALRNLVEDGKYNDVSYHYEVALKEGPSGPYLPPLHKSFNNLNVPRARGSKGDIQDMWWFFDFYEKHPSKKYISDGNVNRVSILKKDEDKINKDKLGDKELYLYEIEE
ncbi:MAG: polysaccharide deacetylase family protein [Vallitalea sp.]|jgi:peptidoglycan/xylan/chitin deacetylase (PgdA/CDA1 family)|nr:polysaccharide deacetylase family protein [Vallitalea sp.]